MTMPDSAANIPSSAATARSRAQHVADRADADAERQRRKSMGDEIAGDRGDADRRQAGRGVAADHEFEGIERAGERRAERARDRRRRAAADHDALVGAAQVKGAAERGGEAAGKLGVSRFKANGGTDAARPDGLQRDDDAAAKRHPPAMQRIGLDRIDLARRPPAQQHEEGEPQQQAAEARNQHGAQRLDAGLARQPLPDADVEQKPHAGPPPPRSSRARPSRQRSRSAPPAPPGWSHGRERMPAAGAALRGSGRWWPFSGPCAAELSLSARFSGLHGPDAIGAERWQRRIRPGTLFTIPSRCL